MITARPRRGTGFQWLCTRSHHPHPEPNRCEPPPRRSQHGGPCSTSATSNRERGQLKTRGAWGNQTGLQPGMSATAPLRGLPQGFRDEQRDLTQAGITNWGQLSDLTDQKLSRLVATGRSTARNLKRLRGIADLVCCLELAPADAALLMHAALPQSRRSQALPRRTLRTGPGVWNASWGVAALRLWIWR